MRRSARDAVVPHSSGAFASIVARLDHQITYQVVKVQVHGSFDTSDHFRQNIISDGTRIGLAVMASWWTS